MSCFLVEYRLVDLLVKRAVELNLIPATSSAVDALGQLLLAFNDASVTEHYGDAPTIPYYIYTPNAEPRADAYQHYTGNDPFQRAANCMIHQCASAPQYPGSAAQLILERIATA